MTVRSLPRTHSRTGRLAVLCVDDEPVILAILTRILELQGIDVTTAPDAATAMLAFDDGRFDLVVTDIHMPGADGLALMHALRERNPGLPVVVVTGHGTVDTAIRALREGATGMLVKPFTADELVEELSRALGTAQMREDALKYHFVSPVLDSIALTLSTAIEARHLETGEHCRQLGVLSERMAAVLGLDGRTQMTIRIGGYLHDIGKIGIADAILLKPGRLSDAEMAEMRRHSEIGAAILGVHETMTEIADIVRHHHERWDGLGYPSGLARADIPIGARIIAVADAFSAMTSDRVYRQALPVSRAWAELRGHAGRQFDPEIVRAFEQIVDADGALVALDPTTEQLLSGPVHVPLSDWRATFAASLLPAPRPITGTPDPCPVASDGDECAVMSSGEGCEIVPPPQAAAG